MMFFGYSFRQHKENYSIALLATMFASSLPNILQELADGVLLFVYLAHSSMSTRYDQSILSTIGQIGKAFVDST